MPMGPIGRGLMMARGAARRPIDDPMFDDEMVYPGGGDLGMELSEPYERNLPPSPLGRPAGPARAVPVHSMPEVEQEYGRMGMKVPSGVRDITGAFQGAQPGPIREQLHAAQHQMMLGDKNTVNQTKRMQINQKRAALQQKIMGLQRAGRMRDADMIRKQLDALDMMLESAMGAVPAE